jgi:hypothetical protein
LKDFVGDATIAAPAVVADIFVGDDEVEREADDSLRGEKGLGILKGLPRGFLAIGVASDKGLGLGGRPHRRGSAVPSGDKEEAESGVATGSEKVKGAVSASIAPEHILIKALGSLDCSTFIAFSRHATPPALLMRDL